MRTRTFITFMCLLLVGTTALLAVSTPHKQAAPPNDCPAGDAGNNQVQTQSGEISMMWESVSRHLLNQAQ